MQVWLVQLCLCSGRGLENLMTLPVEFTQSPLLSCQVGHAAEECWEFEFEGEENVDEGEDEYFLEECHSGGGASSSGLTRSVPLPSFTPIMCVLLPFLSPLFQSISLCFLSIFLSIHLSIHPSLSIHLFIYLFVYLSVHPSIHLSFSLSISFLPSFYLSFSLSIYLTPCAPLICCYYVDATPQFAPPAVVSPPRIQRGTSRPVDGRTCRERVTITSTGAWCPSPLYSGIPPDTDTSS